MLQRCSLNLNPLFRAGRLAVGHQTALRPSDGPVAKSGKTARGSNPPPLRLRGPPIATEASAQPLLCRNFQPGDNN